MKKLKLNLEEIKVESFTVDGQSKTKGTVYGQLSDPHQTYGCCTGQYCSEIYTCEKECASGYSICVTCGNSCNGTCIDPTCVSPPCE